MTEPPPYAAQLEGDGYESLLELHGRQELAAVQPAPTLRAARTTRTRGSAASPHSECRYRPRSCTPSLRNDSAASARACTKAAAGRPQGRALRSQLWCPPRCCHSRGGGFHRQGSYESRRRPNDNLGEFTIPVSSPLRSSFTPGTERHGRGSTLIKFLFIFELICIPGSPRPRKRVDGRGLPFLPNTSAGLSHIAPQNHPSRLFSTPVPTTAALAPFNDDYPRRICAADLLARARRDVIVAAEAEANCLMAIAGCDIGTDLLKRAQLCLPHSTLHTVRLVRFHAVTTKLTN
jgi:hypothetical protein